MVKGGRTIIRQEEFNEAAILPNYLNASVVVGDIGQHIRSSIRVGRDRWIIVVDKDRLLVSAANPEILKRRFKTWEALQDATFHALAYARAAMILALETPCQRSFNSSVLNLSEDEIHLEEEPKRFHIAGDKLLLAQQLIDDIGSHYRVGHHRLVEYRRRGFELELLGYTTEAYFNYYKILELLSDESKGSTYDYVRDKYRDTLAGFERFTQKGVQQESIRNTVARLAQVLNRRHLSRDEFLLLADLVLTRHNSNVAHKKHFTRHGYDSSGGYSFDFEVDPFFLDDLKELSRLFILNTLELRHYWLDLVGGAYLLRKGLESSPGK